MPQADQATTDLLTDYFRAMEVKDFDRLGAYYADDITLKFANAPTITGRGTMLARMVDLLGKVKSLAHPLINVWQEEGGVVIFEVASIWHFDDDCSGECGKAAGRCPQRIQTNRAAGDTKSDAGRRVVGLPGALGDLLREHREEQQQWREAARQLWQDGDWVFTSRVGAPLTRTRTITAGRRCSRRPASGTAGCMTPGTRRPPCS